MNKKLAVFEGFLPNPATCSCKTCTNRRLATSLDHENKYSDFKIYQEPKQESKYNLLPVRQKPKKNEESTLKPEDKLRNRNFTYELEKNQISDSHQKAESQKQELLPPKEPLSLAVAGISAIQNTDKPLTFENCSKDTAVNNVSEAKIDKPKVPDINTQTYKLEHFPRNLMVIFNHEHFTNDDSTRTGTDRDVTALIATFKQFQFEVVTHNDLKRKDFLEKLQKFGKQNFNDCGCVCVAILTHGSDHGYLKAADVRYSERELFACFNTQENPTLVAKPIIFLIQACRGEHLASSVPVIHPAPNRLVELDANSGKESGYSLPTEADMIIFYSCFFGRASVRVVDEGTWFIQTICEQLNLYAATEHLEDIFRRVRTIIAEEKEFEHAKQMPVTSSTLLKKLYLVPQKNVEEKCCVNPTTDTPRLSHGEVLISRHRYFRIQFVPSGASPEKKCWWYAHFDGQHVARQMELRPDEEPVLLQTGVDDIRMCRRTLDETGLTRKRAEIPEHKFETAWARHNGAPYRQRQPYE